jgi:hypothetical protein
MKFKTLAITSVPNRSQPSFMSKDSPLILKFFIMFEYFSFKIHAIFF